MPEASLSSVLEASFLLSTAVDVIAPGVVGLETRLELRARIICIYIARNKTAVLGYKEMSEFEMMLVRYGEADVYLRKSLLVSEIVKCSSRSENRKKSVVEVVRLFHSVIDVADRPELPNREK